MPLETEDQKRRNQMARTLTPPMQSPSSGETAIPNNYEAQALKPVDLTYKPSEDRSAIEATPTETNNQQTPVNYSGAAKGAGAAIQQGGNGGDILAGGLIASGNPYAMGAGLGLATYSAIEKKKQAKEEQARQEELARRSRQQEALQSLTAIASNMREL